MENLANIEMTGICLHALQNNEGFSETCAENSVDENFDYKYKFNMYCPEIIERCANALKNPKDFIDLYNKNSDYLQLARNIAISQDTPPHVIDYIFDAYCFESDDSEEENFVFKHIRRSLANNKTISRRMFEFFSNSKCEITRSSLAQNEGCPSDILEYLAQDSNFFVRCEVAENRNTPTHVLANMIAGQDGKFIRCIVARNKNISEEIAEKLVIDRPNVRYSLASNENISKNIIKRLLEDESVAVRVMAQRHPLFKELECFF